MDSRLAAFGFRTLDPRIEYRRRVDPHSLFGSWLCGEAYVDDYGDARVCMDSALFQIEKTFTHATDGRTWGGRHCLCERHALECVVKQDKTTRTDSKGGLAT